MTALRRALLRASASAGILALLSSTVAAAAAAAAAAGPDDALPLTPQHEAGRCAFRGHCGALSFLGKEVPCVDNGLAAEPDEELRDELLEVCGEKWRTGDVCCTKEQMDALKSELSTPNQFLASCPACRENFYNMFCTFTCSPDQSLFVNVTGAVAKKDKMLVSELDHLISEEYGSGFYGSCKDVKFGPTNANAMDLIGGGAQNYTEMLTFLGKKRAFGGSPFQMNFPPGHEEDGMRPLDMKPRRCDDEDPSYRCVCVDCPDVCLELPAVREGRSCKVGVLPCLSFAAIFTYSVLLFAFLAVVLGHVGWKRHARRRQQRRRLLQDAANSDDEDEGDMTQNGAMLDRPQRYYRLNTWCDVAFSRLGHVAARFPALTITTSLVAVAVLSSGWARFDVETDPARLWVAPTSDAAREKAFFDDNFGPFYRAEKIFLVNDTTGSTGPVLSKDTLAWWIEVEKSVKKIRGPKFGAKLDDVCFKPNGDACVIQSVTAYFGLDAGPDELEDWQARLLECSRSPVECRPDFGQPIPPEMILGGYEDDVREAAAMTVTWVVQNAAERSREVARAKDWEEALKERLLEAQAEASDRGLRLSFNTEMSLEEELNKSTNTDAKIVVVSYVIMFLYASVALGSTTVSTREMVRNPAVALVQSKFTLGVVGILIVLMSISASIGLFSWAGVKATLIIAEVIPFIVLAVGVDNIFLIVHEFERINVSHPDEMVETRVAKTLGRMGPSILFSALTETASFALGALVGMPAVRNFAVYAAGAVFVNAVLQVTMFASVLAWNQMRVEDHRADCFPCVQVKSARVHLSGTNGQANARMYDVPEESVLQQFIRRRYAPFLLRKRVKLAVAAVFLAVFAAGVALMPEVKLGLDQRVAIPDDSYLIPYFDDLYDYLDTGPPVYFVAREFNATARAGQQEICSRFTTCEQMSLTNILEGERKRPEVSYISTPTASWFDDFFLWLNPAADECCTEGTGRSRRACFEGRDPAWNVSLAGMPEGDEFVRYLGRFLASPADESCPLGGQASYGQAVVVDEERDTISASHFRTTHRPLRSQDDFIGAYASARRISAEISASTGLDVFPYSVFYIFFDQYLSIVRLTATLLGAAVAIIFLVSALLLGSVLTALVVTATVAMSLTAVVGCMALSGVSLNAVSLVNLVICVGISVEFCAHVARAFAFPSRTVMERARNGLRGGDARAWAALVNVGASVFSGITVTKLLGVCVLAFTRSKIFELYYFRVWLALVASAAPHALVFLPVALSVLGGRGYVDPESEGGIEEDLASRRYRALVPRDVMSDSDSESSGSD